MNPAESEPNIEIQLAGPHDELEGQPVTRKIVTVAHALDAPVSHHSFVNHAGRTIFVLDGDARAVALQQARGNLNPGGLRLWQQLCTLHDWDYIVDVGANYGEMILSFDLPDSAEVIAIEPSPTISSCLRRSVAESGARIRVEAVAAGAVAGNTLLYVDEQWSGTSTTTPSQATASSRPIATEVVRLDELLGGPKAVANRRVLIKIDVEGGEREVLRGIDTLQDVTSETIIQAEILHTSDEDLTWLMGRYFVHLAERDTTALWRVTHVKELRELLATGRFHIQDAVLATRPLWIVAGSQELGELAWRRYVTYLRGALIQSDKLRAAAAAEAAYAERTRLERLYETSASWRVTRPLRFIASTVRRFSGRVGASRVS